MKKITVIGETADLKKNKSALSLSEFEVEFVDINKNDVTKAFLDDSAAVIVFPWQGFRELFNYNNFKAHIDTRSIIVAGPAIHFFEIENWVVDGSMYFMSIPINSIQLENMINEILRIRSDLYGHEISEDDFAEKSE